MSLRRGSTSPIPGELDASDKLSAWSIAGRVIAAATPLTVVAGVDPVGIAVTGNNFPLVFLLIALVYGLFSNGYLAAARVCDEESQDASSGFYALIRNGLGRTVGVGAGWLAVVAYTALTLGLYGLIGSVLSTPLSDLFGIALPWQAVAIAAAALVGWLGLLKFKTPTQVLVVLVTCEVAMIGAATVANWLHPATGTRPLDALDPHQLTVGTPVIAAQLALAVLGYIGTELTVVHADHARGRHSGVARATITVLAILTVLYVLTPAGLSVTLGIDGVVTAAQTDPAGLFVRTAEANLGPQFAAILQILFATSVLAGAISFHGTTSLYCVRLARDSAAPAILERTGTKHGSPTAASVAQTILALAAIAAVWVTGADPVQVLFYLGGTSGAVAILALLSFTALSTVIILRRHHRTAESRIVAAAAGLGPAIDDDRTASPARRVWRVVAALAATLLIGALTVTVMIKLDTLLGVAPDSPAPTIMRVSYLVVFLAGVGWNLWHRPPPAARATSGSEATR
ncbi:Uncharacterised protein [Amycolatopsis camponoti]|uniref:APC family permease n=1 Tax=Amycolatopsis camponoti TaxID=2606593 RepID=A0A6I8M1A3_9PSEU|nr:APC family permease [Amycolatopsis camponoti]VVJ22657.1 Uncharacterised protein [Amycolatopsis camponoti]